MKNKVYNKNNLQVELSFTDEFSQASRLFKSFDPIILDNHHEKRYWQNHVKRMKNYNIERR
ncbi:hypothetical protein C6370_20185 [Bacillus atrophaeus]|nr:hypothetical protein C6370_20185 [Bacillus atrophaeus]